MDIKILGCSGNYVGRHRTTCFQVDESLLIDAGTITDVIRRKDLPNIKRIILTHSHMDHLKGLFSFLDELLMMGGHSVELVSAAPVIEIISDNLFNNLIWPDFTVIPTEANAVVKLRNIPVGKPSLIDGVTVRPVPMNHTVYTVGYVIKRPGGEGFMFTADTGPTEEFWEIACQEKNVGSIIADVSFPDRLADLARVSGHMTPSILMETIDRYGLEDRIFYVSHIKPIFAREIVRAFEASGRPNIRILKQADIIRV